MKTVVEFSVPGAVKGLNRAKAAAFGKRARVYDDPANMPRRDAIKWAFMCSIGEPVEPYAVYEGPVWMTVTCYRAIPKSVRKAKAEQMKGQPCSRKPDRDNVVKLVGDALIGIAYHDDCQVQIKAAMQFWTAGAERMNVWLEYDKDHR